MEEDGVFDIIMRNIVYRGNGGLVSYVLGPWILLTWN